MLIQQELLGEADYPWRMLVACLLLNRTRGTSVRPVLQELLRRWPSPKALAAADGRSLGPVVARLGFRRQRVDRLRRMSRAYASGAWSSPGELPGVGRYASDSWAIFVDGRVDLQPGDKQLAIYLAGGHSATRRRIQHGG